MGHKSYGSDLLARATHNMHDTKKNKVKKGYNDSTNI